MFKTLLTTLIASLSLLTATTAQASPAAALSLANAPALTRAASDTGEASELTGATADIIAGIALGLIVWGIVELSDSN